MSDSSLQSNQDLWDRWTELHISPQSDYAEPLARFRAGETTLQEIEIAELGDVAGKTLLHLQCHFGLDTLSWARRGAIVTGVDFSQAAIDLARSLSVEAGIPARFMRADVLQLEPPAAGERFDVVYTSYGVLPWLPDLNRWAAVIAQQLRRGGVFYVVDVHPIHRILLPPRIDGTGAPIVHHYFGSEPVQVQERGSYARSDVDELYRATYWTHSLGKVVTALCAAGLRIEFLHEFPGRTKYSCAIAASTPGRYERRPVHDVVIPKHFSVRAVR
jgi:SAM-dependent methyltransferase